MTRPHQQLNSSLRFQLSLLRLAVAPHQAGRRTEGEDATLELARLAKKIPATKKRARPVK